jgi:hypothetical protein
MRAKPRHAPPSGAMSRPTRAVSGGKCEQRLSYDHARAETLFRSARCRRRHAARQQVGTVRQWGHLSRKSLCFPMCPGDAYWGHFAAKSCETSTNGLDCSEWRWLLPRRPIPQLGGARCRRRAWRRLQEPQGCLGRYHNSPWPADADCAARAGSGRKSAVSGSAARGS